VDGYVELPARFVAGEGVPGDRPKKKAGLGHPLRFQLLRANTSAGASASPVPVPCQSSNMPGP